LIYHQSHAKIAKHHLTELVGVSKMHLADEILKLRPRAERATEYQTEEATKNALIMPMIRPRGQSV
jgi:hypothetical protein